MYNSFKFFFLGAVGSWSFRTSQVPQLSYPSQTRLSLFDGVLENFVGKKYGAGQYFYGERSTNEQRKLQQQALLKPNAILVVGAPTNEVCQSVLIELLEKGFAVRYACDDATQAFQELGSSGFNFDIVELHAGSLLSPASTERDFAAAVQDVQAIVLCKLNEDKVKFWDKGKYSLLSQKLLNVSLRALRAGVLGLKKVVVTSDRSTAAASPVQLALVGNVNFAAIYAPQGYYRSKVGTADHLKLQLISGERPQPAAARPAGPGEGIASADLAELVVQALLQDIVANATITVHTTGGNSCNNDNNGMRRPRRDAFYRLNTGNAGEIEPTPLSVEQASRDAACRQLKAWGAVRPVEEIKKQLLEDEAVQSYWAGKFRAVTKLSEDL